MTQTVHYTFDLQPNDRVTIVRSDGITLTAAPIGRLGAALAPHWFSTEDAIQILKGLRETGRPEKTIELVGRGLTQVL